ncbi:MAG: glycosyltransferase family 39 protein [Vicinamibacterales bacterium]
MTTPEPGGREGRWIWAALALGLVFRLVVLTQTTGLGTVIVDEQHYAQLARTLVQDGVYGMSATTPTSIRPPLFPGMVAALWSVTGVDHFQIVRVVNIVLAGLTTWLVYLLGCELFTPRVGRLSAVVFWLYPSLIFFDFTILTETLFTCVFVGAILLLARLVRRPGAGVALGAGAVLGLSALTRSVIWPVPLVLCPALVLLIPGRLTTRVGLAALVLAGHVVVLSPWAIRNTKLQGVVTVVDTMGGLNLRMGNYEHTPDDRMWDAVNLQGEQNWAWALREDFPGRTQFTEGDKDKWAQSRALRYMAENPAITLRRSVIKVSDFFGLEREFAAGIGQGLFAPPRWFGVLASVVIIVVYVAVVLIGVAGAWLTPAGWREHVTVLLPLLGVLGGHALAFGHSRYHMPLMPVLGVFAVALVTHGWPAIRRAAIWQRAGAGVCAAALLAIWAYQVLVVDAERIRGLLQQVIGS